MTRDQVLAKIGEILSDVLERDGLVITEQTKADDVEGWDSVNHVRLLIALERALDVRFETDETSSIENVGRLVDVIQQKV